MKRDFKKYFRIILISISLLILFNSRFYPQEAKITKRVMTESEFQKLKKLVGTYEEGKNYDQIIDGHGTGLRPPTEEEWEKIKNHAVIVDEIKTHLKTKTIPSSFDNSATIWFPPIGDQGSQNSCVSWASGYYTKTFQEAREHNWDLSGCIWTSGHPSSGYQDKIFSPAFIYHMLDLGKNAYTDAVRSVLILENIGCCTWDKMPYKSSDYKTWPSEEAWRQAAWYRSKSAFGWYIAAMWTDSDAGIENLKNFLSNGNLGLIAVNSSFFYSNLGPKDLWTLDNYNPSSTNHENTIVGYDDNYGPYSESGNSNVYGAFKVANSWGVGGWENVRDGFYYVSYECLKQRIPWVNFYQNQENYAPQLVAVIKINHNFRSNNLFDLGVGDPGSPSIRKYLNDFSTKGGDYPFPSNPIVLDITEFIPYMNQSNTQIFLGDLDHGTSGGTIESFSVEMFDDYASGIPKKVYISPETPINTVQDSTIWVTVYTQQLTIKPNITLQPVNQTVTEGQLVSFRVEATCSGPLGFQWWKPGGQWNNGDKNGRLSVVNTPNSSVLSISNTVSSEDDNNKFLCEVKNLDGYPADGYWINTNTVILTVPLPVELTSFKAVIQNDNILLNWETATEVNNYGFEIERKRIAVDTKEGNWTKVGFVDGHGNSNSPKNYSFIDKNITGGTKFDYRLKQIDIDGKYEFSKEIQIEVTPREYILYQNYPNPFNPSTTIKFALPKNSHVVIKLFDVIGREVKTLLDEDKQAGIFEIQFSGADLSNGVYFYSMESGNFTSTRKFVLMK